MHNSLDNTPEVSQGMLQDNIGRKLQHTIDNSQIKSEYELKTKML